MTIKKVSNSRVVQTQLVLPGDTNRHNTLYGGNLTSMIDNVASICFMRHTRCIGVTASMDRLNFIKPIPVDTSVCLEAMVSGVGTKSVEIFVKVVCEELLTGNRFLAATAFVTFAKIDDHNTPIPQIEGETEEEVYILSGYKARKEARLEERQADIEFHQKLTIDTLWEQPDEE